MLWVLADHGSDGGSWRLPLVLSRDNENERASHDSLYMTRVLPYVNTVAGSAISSLSHERWVDGRRLEGLYNPLYSLPERVKVAGFLCSGEKFISRPRAPENVTGPLMHSTPYQGDPLRPS